MSWYYHQTYGEIVEYTGWQKFLQDREIDQEKLAAKVGIPQSWFGPFATQAEAQAFKTGHPSAIDQAKAVAAQPIAGVEQAIANFGNTIVKLSTRLAEAAVGIVLLAIAANVILKQLTGVDVAGSAVRTTKKAGKAAATAAVV